MRTVGKIIVFIHTQLFLYWNLCFILDVFCFLLFEVILYFRITMARYEGGLLRLRTLIPAVLCNWISDKEHQRPKTDRSDDGNDVYASEIIIRVHLHSMNRQQLQLQHTFEKRYNIVMTLKTLLFLHFELTNDSITHYTIFASSTLFVKP